jgi:hypothetical protein
VHTKTRLNTRISTWICESEYTMVGVRKLGRGHEKKRAKSFTS